MRAGCGAGGAGGGVPAADEAEPDDDIEQHQHLGGAMGEAEGGCEGVRAWVGARNPVAKVTIGVWDEDVGEGKESVMWRVLK